MVEAQEREEPLSEAKAGKILDAVYEKALNGIPMVSRSVDEIANDYLSRHDTPEAAARSLARWQVAKCGTSGFLSGLGGIITLPVTIPANIGSVMYVQMRMIAAIAKMGGYDVNSDQVQTLVYMCLVSSAIRVLASHQSPFSFSKMAEFQRFQPICHLHIISPEAREAPFIHVQSVVNSVVLF